MIVCDNCFIDSEIINVIRSFKVTGVCDVCGSKSFVYNTEIHSVLSNYLTSLLDIYLIEDHLTIDYPEEKKNYLKYELKDNWPIFNQEFDYEIIEMIVREVLVDYDNLDDMFSKRVAIPELNDNDYLNQYSIMKTHLWEEFVTSIKNDYRFHSNHMNLLILERYFRLINKNYEIDETFFRGRISDERKYSVTEMGAPPKKFASAGRANPLGISYLYLSSNEDTTIYETRSGLYDIITIGEFSLSKNICVVDLTAFSKISPFSGLDLVLFYINRNHLSKINDEIAKPLRKNDSKLDYVPTQYIVEYIKSLKKYDGIQFKSSLTRNGYNLVLFDEQNVKCKSTTLFKVEDIIYKYNPIE